MKKCLFLMIGLILIAGMAFAANPATVGPTGDFATIQAALASWCLPGGSNIGETAPLVININPAGTYEEILDLANSHVGLIKGALIVQSATPGTPVLVKVRRNPTAVVDPVGTSGTDDGFYIYQPHDNITFNEIIFCPSILDTATLLDDLVKVDEAQAVANVTTPTIANTITFNKCVFSDIATVTGAPFVTSKADVLAKTYPADILALVKGSGMTSGDDLLKWWGDPNEGMSLTLQDCVFFGKDCRTLEAVCSSPNEAILIKDCLFATSAMGNYPISARPSYAGCTATITGTQAPRLGDLTKCTAVLAGWGHPIYCSGGSTTPIGNAIVKNFLADTEGGTLAPTADIRPLSGGAEGKTIEDSIFCIKTRAGSYVDYPVVANSIYNRNTMYSNQTTSTGKNFFYLGSAADPFGIKITDSVIAGPGCGANSGTYDVGGFTLTNCAIATAGADAITTIGAPPVQINCVLGDPMILSTNVKNANFMDTSAAGLFMKASDAGSIGGGANYTVADAGDNVENVFKSIGDCEGDLITQASTSSGYGDLVLAAQQDQVPGVIGNACYMWYSGWTRLEGSTSDIGPLALTDNDQTFSFYYKIVTQYSSYPYISLRQNPPTPETGRVESAAGWKLWNKATGPFTVDGMWHQFTPDISVLSGISPFWYTWTGIPDTDLFVNLISTSGVRGNYIDEIVLDDPNVTGTRVEDWGLL
jgi:hypothetical protein